MPYVKKKTWIQMAPRIGGLSLKESQSGMSGHGMGAISCVQGPQGLEICHQSAPEPLHLLVGVAEPAWRPPPLSPSRPRGGMLGYGMGQACDPTDYTCLLNALSPTVQYIRGVRRMAGKGMGQDPTAGGTYDDSSTGFTDPTLALAPNSTVAANSFASWLSGNQSTVLIFGAGLLGFVLLSSMMKK
jgi:hypothetical protein